MYINKKIRSIGFAIQGIRQMVRTESNARIHLSVTALVIIAGLAMGLSVTKWIAIVFAIAIVWITEAVNTAMEKLCDHACGMEYSEPVKRIKDIAAGAVLIATVCSIITGIIVFTVK